MQHLKAERTYLLNPSLTVTLPSIEEDVRQDVEWCQVCYNGTVRRIRFHDYASIYDIPGLYEAVFHKLLRCSSPSKIAGMLARAVREDGGSLDDLRVLDYGAGNGLVGEALQGFGIQTVFGVDSSPAASRAVKPAVESERAPACWRLPAIGTRQRSIDDLSLSVYDQFL